MPLSSIFPDFVLGHPKNHDGTHNVPQPQAPKSRPPKSLRDQIPLYGKLPRSSGPYSIGLMDLEVPANNPRVFSNITRKNHHILALETVLVTIYYPSHFGSGSGPAPSGLNHWSRPTWLPRPRPKISAGYGRFAKLPEWLIVVFFFVTAWFTKIPAFRNAALATHWPPESNSRKSGWDIKNQSGRPPPGQPDEPMFPLIMFSHGLGGTRAAYSSVCGEFASYGFVVCALEHRDGSGPRTLVNHPANGLGCREERERTGGVDHAPGSSRVPYDIVDFIFPQKDHNDTAPGHTVDKKLRAAQVELRLAELEEAFEVMRLLCAGEGDILEKHNLRRPGTPGASSHGLRGVDWRSWKNRFHLESVTVVGHSFGAATTVEILRHSDRFQWVSQGIIYDIWGMAVSPPEGNPEHRIHSPLLGINSEAFMYWPDNFKVAKQLCQEAFEHENLAWLMTVRGTVHISQSDFGILYPHISSVVMKTLVNPIRAMDLNITASLEFLSRVLPLPIKPFHRSLDDEKLLDIPCLKEMPTEHQPSQRWMAIRLKIRHEALKRITPGSRRKVHKKMLESGEREVWMHVSPTSAQLRSFQHRDFNKRHRLRNRASENDDDDKVLVYSDDPARDPSKTSTGEESNEIAQQPQRQTPPDHG